MFNCLYPIISFFTSGRVLALFISLFVLALVVLFYIVIVLYIQYIHVGSKNNNYQAEKNNNILSFSDAIHVCDIVRRAGISDPQRNTRQAKLYGRRWDPKIWACWTQPFGIGA